MKIFILGITVFVLILSCSSKNDKSHNLNDSTNHMAKDTFYVEGKVSLKAYVTESGANVKEWDNSYFYLDSIGKRKNKKSILIKSIEKVINQSNEQPVKKLRIEAYESKDNVYNLLLWKIEENGVEPIGIWENYFQVKEQGCCAAEAGSVLYDLRNGKEFIRFSGDLKYVFWSYLGYHSSSSVNFEPKGDTTIKGILYYLTTDFDEGIQKIFNYSVHIIDYANIQFERTPEMEVIGKASLIESGFFRAFSLFKNGEKLKSLDTADQYLKLTYGFKELVLVPFDEKNILNESELITSDQSLSKRISITKGIQNKRD